MSNLDFIEPGDWPVSSPYLKLLWSALENIACSKRHYNLESPKTSLERAVANLPMDFPLKSSDDWPKRSKALCKS